MKKICLATLLAFLITPLLHAGPDGDKGKPDGKGPGDPNRPRPDPAAMFAKIDTNSDGKISREEYLASPRAQKNPEKAAESFTRMDKNADGFLTPDEMMPPKRPEGGPGGGAPPIKRPPPSSSES